MSQLDERLACELAQTVDRVASQRNPQKPIVFKQGLNHGNCHK